MELYLLALLLISCFTVPLLFLKLYIVLTTRWNHSPVCLVGKTCIVTGSNIGIGYYTALDFAKRGARVILACRNKEKADAARAQMIEATGNNNIVVKILDLSSLKSVREFAKNVNETEEKLDILVNNAGIGIDNSYSNDGLCLTIQTNHFGPFLLTILLIGLLKKSAPSRIVTVSSNTASFAKINIENLNVSSQWFSGMHNYAISKLCNLLFTIKLAHKLKGTNVTANVLHPGVVQTDILKDAPNLISKIASVLMRFAYMSSEAGAQTSIYVAIAKELEGVTGKYFVDCAESTYTQAAQNKILADKLWDKSKEFVQLTAEEESDLLD